MSKGQLFPKSSHYHNCYTGDVFDCSLDSLTASLRFLSQYVNTGKVIFLGALPSELAPSYWLWQALSLASESWPDSWNWKRMMCLMLQKRQPAEKKGAGYHCVCSFSFFNAKCLCYNCVYQKLHFSLFLALAKQKIQASKVITCLTQPLHWTNTLNSPSRFSKAAPSIFWHCPLFNRGQCQVLHWNPRGLLLHFMIFLCLYTKGSREIDYILSFTAA